MKKHKALFFISSIICSLVATYFIFNSLKGYELDLGYILINVFIAICIGFSAGFLIMLIATAFTSIMNKVRPQMTENNNQVNKMTNTGKPIILLGVLILTAAIIISGVQLFMWYESKDAIAPKDRYFYGVNSEGYIVSVADKVKGKVNYRSDSVPDWYYK